MSRKGFWVVKQKTASDRLRRSIKRITVWCRLHRHEPVSEQWMALRRKLLGHFAYFGITGNYPALHNFSVRVVAVRQKWLSRRSQRAWMSREKMTQLLEQYPLPQPRLRSSPIYVAKPWTEEPDAGNPHVRMCVQRRLARSVGDSPAEARARSLVAWMAGRRETNDLKPIDRVIVRMAASHRAVAQANAQVAPKVSSLGGRARNCRVKAASRVVGWLTRLLDSGGVVAAAR